MRRSPKPTTKPWKNSMRLIESDAFPFEFLSQLAERESWRKEVHRPIYHVHKWWAKRLGSVFRGILLGAKLPEDHDLAKEFYQTQHFANVTVIRPLHGLRYNDRRGPQARPYGDRPGHQSGCRRSGAHGPGPDG